MNPLRFGTLVLTEEDVLRSPAGTWQLSQRLARVLRKLAAGNGAIVSKDELLDQCWGRDRGDEQTLAKAISDLREILAAAGAHVIETVYRRGYRLRTELDPSGRLTNRDRAHSICLEAAHRLHQPDAASLLAAARLYEMAAAAYDERSVEARLGYADAHLRSMTAGYVPPRAAWRMARRALDEVFRIQPDCAAAHALHAYGAMSVDWDFAGAGASAARALRVAPLAFSSNYFSAWLCLSLGRSAQAVACLRKAVDSDPIATNAKGLLSYALLCAGRDTAACQAALHPLPLEPENPLLQAFHSWIEATVGDPARASRAGAAAHRKLPESSTIASIYAYALVRTGSHAEARKLLEQTRNRHVNEYGGHSLASICWLAMGDRHSAVASLEHALQARCCWLPTVLHDPRNAALRGDPAFEAIVSRVFRSRSSAAVGPMAPACTSALAGAKRAMFPHELDRRASGWSETGSVYPLQSRL